MQYIAKINETECVGCNRCVPACPVDAIVGSLSLTHSVITQECIGCKLCLAPCPTECIDIIEINEPTKEIRIQRAMLAKKRHSDKIRRLAKLDTPLLTNYDYAREEGKINIKKYINKVKQNKMDNGHHQDHGPKTNKASI